MLETDTYKGNPNVLFFIMIYLLLFYDNSFLVTRRLHTHRGDSTLLFFILDFLLLFY